MFRMNIIRLIVWLPVIVFNFSVALLVGSLAPHNHTLDYKVGVPILVIILASLLLVLGATYLEERTGLRKQKPKDLPIAMDMFVFVVPPLLGFVLGVFM